MADICNGDVGYCAYRGGTTALLTHWNDQQDTVLKVECDHVVCGFANECELYRCQFRNSRNEA